MPNYALLPDITISDFSGGMVTQTAQHELTPSQARILKNLVVEQGGFLTTRPALKTRLAVVEASKAVLGLYAPVKSDGTKYLLACINSSTDTQSRLYRLDSDGANKTLITRADASALNFTANKHRQFAQFGDKVYSVNGTDAEVSWAFGATADYLTAVTAPTALPVVVAARNAFTNLATNTGTPTWTEDTDTKWDVTVDAAELSVILTASGDIGTTDATIYRQEAAARNVNRSLYVTVEGTCSVAGKQVDIQFGTGTTASPVWNANLVFNCKFDVANQWKPFAFFVGGLSESDRASLTMVRFIRRASILKTESFVMRFKNLAHSGGLEGSYEYAYTYYNSTTGIESPLPRDSNGNIISAKANFNDPAWRSASVTVTGTALVSSEPAKIRLYRRGGTRTDWYRVDQIANPGASTTTGADVWRDEWLGLSSGIGNFTDGTAANLALFLASNRGVPPTASTIVARNNRMWRTDISNVDRATFSAIEDAENVPVVSLFDESASRAEGGYFAVPGKKDGERLVAFVPGKRMLFLKENGCYYIDGDSMSDFIAQKGAQLLSLDGGCRSARSVAWGTYGAYWLGPKVPMWSDGISAPIPIGYPVEDQFASDAFVTGPAVADLEVAVAVHSRGRYLLCYKNTAEASGSTGGVMVYDTRRARGNPQEGQWARWVFTESSTARIPSAACVRRGTSQEEAILLGFDDGAIYELDETKNTRDIWNGTTTGIAWEYESAVFQMPKGMTYWAVAVMVYGDCGSTSETITATIKDDGGTTLGTASIAVSGSSFVGIGEFTDTVQGEWLAVNLAGTRPSTVDQTFKIRKVVIKLLAVRGPVN